MYRTNEGSDTKAEYGGRLPPTIYVIQQPLWRPAAHLPMTTLNDSQYHCKIYRPLRNTILKVLGDGGRREPLEEDRGRFWEIDNLSVGGSIHRTSESTRIHLLLKKGTTRVCLMSPHRGMLTSHLSLSKMGSSLQSMFKISKQRWVRLALALIHLDPQEHHQAKEGVR